MLYFLDTEFIESGPTKPIQLISIGIVSEDLRQLYRISSEFNPNDASQWVKDNVLSQLEDYERGTLSQIAADILQFCDPDQFGKPEFWGYYSDYDWVVFAQIFGTMMDLPAGFPMYCRDLKQWCDQLGNPKLPDQGKGEHNALADAAWNMKAWQFLKELEQ
jgi:hypothetical protein